MKKIVILLMLVLCISFVYAERTCQDIVEPDTVCEIITPVIDCSTYDLYNSTLELRIDDGTMSQIGTTGMYNFTFNQPDVGSHKILLCDNTSATIEVEAYSQKAIYDNNLDNFSTLSSQLTSNISNLQSYGDNNWSTSTGFSTHSAGDIWTVGSRTLTAINFEIFSSWNLLQNYVWNTTTRTVINDTQTILNQMNDNFTSLQTYGDNNWSTAIGFMTDTIMNDSHGQGLYNISDASISASDKTDIAVETNLMINNSHGLGLYNSSSTAVISAADIATIANETFKKIIQNRTEVFFNNSLGYPVYDIWNYANDGVTINITYGYWPDNMTILNRTYSRSP